MSKNGVPTEYRYLRFRSRLEATWARFFDLIGWKWKYEPFDYAGYIPDFVLLLPAGPVLVEVKPELSTEDMPRHTEKICDSPWNGEALILGVGLLDEDEGYRTLGLLCGTGHPWVAREQEDRPCEAAHLHWCTSHPQHAGFHGKNFLGWTCRYSRG